MKKSIRSAYTQAVDLANNNSSDSTANDTCTELLLKWGKMFRRHDAHYAWVFIVTEQKHCGIRQKRRETLAGETATADQPGFGR